MCRSIILRRFKVSLNIKKKVSLNITFFLSDCRNLYPICVNITRKKGKKDKNIQNIHVHTLIKL